MREHGRQQSACNKCGGSSICQHGRQCPTNSRREASERASGSLSSSDSHPLPLIHCLSSTASHPLPPILCLAASAHPLPLILYLPSSASLPLYFSEQASRQHTSPFERGFSVHVQFWQICVFHEASHGSHEVCNLRATASHLICAYMNRHRNRHSQTELS